MRTFIDKEQLVWLPRFSSKSLFFPRFFSKISDFPHFSNTGFPRFFFTNLDFPHFSNTGFPRFFFTNLDFPHFSNTGFPRFFSSIFTGWLLVARGTRWGWVAWAGPDAPCPGWTAPPGRPGTRGIDSPRSPWTRTVSGQNGATYIKKWKLCSKTEKHGSAAIGIYSPSPFEHGVFVEKKIYFCFRKIKLN